MKLLSKTDTQHVTGGIGLSVPGDMNGNGVFDLNDPDASSAAKMIAWLMQKDMARLDP